MGAGLVGESPHPGLESDRKMKTRQAMDRDRILLTPGPLTTTLRTKLAMLRDWGSWDSDFNEVTARRAPQPAEHRPRRGHARGRALAGQRHLQRRGGGRHPVPRDGHVLVLDNGAYCKRAAKLTSLMGRRCTVMAFDEAAPVSAAALDDKLAADTSITHVVLIHCETGAGVLNPLQTVADVCEKHGKGLIVDAMSSFGALPIDARETRFDALVAASGKCLEGVPGMGFVFIRKAILDGCAGSSQSLAMDLHDQHIYMEKTGQWRFTPPTHVVVALAEAIAQFEEEGGQPARLARYTQQLPDADPRHGGPGLHAVPGPGDPGADHRHLPRAGRPALRLQALLCGRARSAVSSCIRASSHRSRLSA